MGTEDVTEKLYEVILEIFESRLDRQKLSTWRTKLRLISIISGKKVYYITYLFAV